MVATWDSSVIVLVESHCQPPRCTLLRVHYSPQTKLVCGICKDTKEGTCRHKDLVLAAMLEDESVGARMNLIMTKKSKLQSAYQPLGVSKERLLVLPPKSIHVPLILVPDVSGSCSCSG